MRSFRSVDWAMIGTFIGGGFVIAAFALAYFVDLFWGSLMFGVFAGWWACGIFWTFWIDNNKEAPK